MQPGGGNATHWGNPWYGFGRTSTDPWGVGAPQPWHSGEYVPVNMLYIDFNGASLLMLSLNEAVSPIQKLRSRRHQPHRVPNRCTASIEQHNEPAPSIPRFKHAAEQPRRDSRLATFRLKLGQL